MIGLDQFVDSVTGAAIPPATMLKILHRQAGPLVIDARVRVVDALLKLVTTAMPVPKGWTGAWDGSDLSRWIIPQGATISYDTTRPIRRTFTFTMIDPAYDPLYAGVEPPGFNPYTEYLHVSQWIYCAQLATTFEVPLGYFWAVMPSAQISPGKRLLTWQLSDLTALIGKAPLLSDWTIPTGQAGGYIQVVKDILSVSGLPASQGGTGRTYQGNDDAGPGIANSYVDIDPVGNQAIAYPIIQTMGFNRYQWCTDLLDAINYTPLWMRTVPQAGSVLGKMTFRSSQAPQYSASIPPVTFDFSPMPGTSIVEGIVNQDFGSQAQSSVANIIKVASSQTTPGGLDFTALVLNTNPSSVINLYGLRALDGGPRAMSLVDKNSKVANQGMASLRATLLAQLGAQLPETVAITTLPMALLEDSDYVTCQVTDKNGVVLVPSSAASPFRVVSWDLPLIAIGGRMNIVLQRVVPI